MDCCKVGEVADRRGLEVGADLDFHEYLVARWLGVDSYPKMGVRKLADWFNQQILRESYALHGRNITDVRITSEYEALADGDEVAQGEVIDDLSSDGIDGRELIDDFVSRSTMRRHLNDCLGATKDQSKSDSRDSNWELEQIAHSKQHLLTNVEESVRSLANKEQLPGGNEVEIDIPVFLSCPECPTQVRLETALDREYICKDHLGAASTSNAEPLNSLD